MNKTQFAAAPEQPITPTPDEFFASIRKQQQTEQRRGRELTVEEERKMQDGFAVQEMTHSAGWQIVQEILQNMPRSHVDPRGMAEAEWKFAELNAFWQGAVASELLEGLTQLVNDAHQLHRIKLGEVQDVQKMRV